MINPNSKHGKREAAGRTSRLARCWAGYKGWLAGLNRGQRIRYRVLQAATVLAVVIIAVFAALSSWIRVPELPSLSPDVSNEFGDLSEGLSFDGAEIPDIVRSGRREGIYTFLLVGQDTASGSTDTMLLISYDTKEKTIRGLNLPRDTMINTSTTSKRLNAVYSYNKGKDKDTQVEKGMAALKKEVANLTGITPDFYILVQWEAIGELVDALGGVEFEVPFDMDYDDPYQDLHIHQKAGLRLLTGDDAMQVIRHRKNNDGSHSNGDVGRLAIQQDFLKAVAKKCLQPATFLKVPELAKIFKENVVTDLTMGNILAFAQLAYGMDPDTGVSFSTAPLADSFLYKSASLVTLDAAGILEVVNDGMNPYLRDIQASDLKVVVRNSNGSFSVTNGTLADPAMGRVPQVSTTKPAAEEEEPLEPIDPIETTDPDGSGGQTVPDDNGQTGDGGASQGGDSSQPPDTSEGTEAPEENNQQPAGNEEDGRSEEGGQPQDGGGAAIDPDQVLPDPNAVVSQDIGGTGEENGSGSVALLPSRPEPAEQAA